MSLRGGCEAAVATVEGLPIARNLKRGHGGHELNLLDWVFELKRRPGAAATIEGRARGIRQKLRKWRRDPAATQWLATMRHAFLVALQTWVADPAAADAEIASLADFAGETAYAEKLFELAQIVRRDAERQISARGISHPSLRA